MADEPQVVAVVAVASGSASGPALVLDEPLSLWGGLDPESGRIIDRHHPQDGEVVTGAVVVMPAGRGSSSASSVLVESIRLGTAPVAFVLTDSDEILVLGALVGEELYGVTTPIVVLREDRAIHTGDRLRIDGSTLTTWPAAGSPSGPTRSGPRPA